MPKLEVVSPFSPAGDQGRAISLLTRGVNDGLRFQTRPLYTGNPWFLAPSIHYYRWKDRLGG